jgi:UDP-3-O-[3-hydroxymyristoyl] glucosamine N-acyltransferase
MKPKTVKEIAEAVRGRVYGDETILIWSISDLSTAGEGAVSFVENEKVIEEARRSRASCLIVSEGFEIESRTVIRAERPKLAFAKAAQLLAKKRERISFVHPTAIVENSAEIASDVYIGAYARVGSFSRIGNGTVIGDGVSIGSGVSIGQMCELYPNVCLYDNVVLGNNVILHSGVIIGADGFGYVRDSDGYIKFPQIGTVLIEDDVEIGANSCVDRGALGPTRIGRGTKIDNLVQIAHNVDIGRRVVIASQTGISGSTVIEDDAVIGGQVGMGDHARVTAGAVIGSKAGILPGKIVRSGSVMWGIPARPLEEFKKLNAYFGKLPQMKADIDEIKKTIKEIISRL